MSAFCVVNKHYPIRKLQLWSLDKNNHLIPLENNASQLNLFGKKLNRTHFPNICWHIWLFWNHNTHVFLWSVHICFPLEVILYSCYLEAREDESCWLTLRSCVYPHLERHDSLRNVPIPVFVAMTSRDDVRPTVSKVTTFQTPEKYLLVAAFWAYKKCRQP